ncbi:GGDEF domain-containing protein [Cryptosporangium arvum]|uniref:GGDEF domain-containing protein n=1 Tax=Cryptosporangium arvum TaxID=80871 RepID=UPI0004AFA6B4|nr:GGDEF domain-containing protein [Cryptosporangium arvum]
MNVREVIRGWSLLHRVRGVFLLYAVFCAIGPLVQVAGSSLLAPAQRTLLDVTLVALVAWWTLRWRTGGFPRAAEPAEWVVVGATIAFGTDNETAVNLVFGALCFRTFYGNAWDLVQRIVCVEAAILVAPLVRREFTPDFQGPAPALGGAVAVLSLLMFVLKNALEQHERMVARERILAQGAAAVVAATDRPTLYRIATGTALGLAGEGDGVRTTLSRGEGLTTCIRAADGDGVDGLVGLEVHYDRMPPPLLELFREGRPIYLEGAECAQLTGVTNTDIRRGGLFLVPLRTATKWLGAMSIGADGPLRAEIRASMVTWATQVASSLETLQLNEELTRQAFHDSLTGLPNRALVHDRLRMALNTRSQARLVAFMLLDLDGFKQVNDQYGHQAGDELLCEVANRLVGCVRQSDTVGRLGGDEFAVILPGVHDQAEGLRIADRLVESIRTPITADGHPVVVGASIGVAFAEHGTGGDLDELMRAADTAMYQVKGAGRGGYSVADTPAFTA